MPENLLKDSFTNQIIRDLGYSHEEFELVLNTAPLRYKKYTIKKKKNGHRQISNPAAEVKTIQYWLTKNFLEKFSINSCATAYMKECSVKKNASLHLNNNFLLKMD